MFEKHLQKNDILSKDAGQASNFIKKGIQHRIVLVAASVAKTDQRNKKIFWKKMLYK